MLALRKERGLTLEMLARMSGVSRSMLSQIERGETNPTLATVWSLATALKLDISELVAAQSMDTAQKIEFLSAHFTPEIRSPDGGCRLRILSPADQAGSLEWYDVWLDVGAALRSEAHARGMREHLSVIEGSLRLELPDNAMTIAAGETARYAVDVPHAILNTGTQAARALLIVSQ